MRRRGSPARSTCRSSQSVIVNLNEIRPSTYLGKGKVEELAQLIEEQKIALVVMDCALSPVQQRNLERAFKAKIDRSDRLDPRNLRASRANARRSPAGRTRPSRLSALAARALLDASRAAAWRLRVSGRPRRDADRDGPPIDRGADESHPRAISIRCERTRSLNRKRRNDVPFPIVALVGYTNAGKSTLFNRLTQAGRAGARHAVCDARPDLAATDSSASRQGHSLRHGRVHL